MRSSRENTQALFAGEPTERVGLADNPWGETVQKWVSQGYPTEKATRKARKRVVEDGRELEKEVVAFIHSYGAKVVLHSCGFTMPALPLIVDAGFDGLNPMEVAAGNDILKAAEAYGKDLVFVGGFDKRIFETHDKALIRRDVTRFMTGMKARGARFLFGSDHSISTNTDYEDYRYALEVYRDHMMY